MSFKSSNSLAILAALGCCATLGLAPSLRAGDKIEFSTPSAPLAVPQPIRPEKELTPDEISNPRPEDAITAAEMESSAGVVVVTAAPNKKHFDSLFSDETGDSGKSALKNGNPYVPGGQSKTLENLANPFAPHNAQTGFSHNNIFDKNSDATADNNSLPGKIKSLKDADKIDYTSIDYNDDAYYGKREDSETPWVKKFFRHELSVIAGTMDTHSDTPYYDQMMKSALKAAKAQAAKPIQSEDLWRSPVDEQLRTVTTPSAVTAYDDQLDMSLGKRHDDTQAPIRYYHSPEAAKSYLPAPNPWGPMMPPASPPGYVQSQPAVLPFPKRPGSLFQ